MLMKILILCTQPESMISGGMINTLSTIYAYHFTKWLSKFPNCVINYASAYLTINDAKLLNTYDFCISLVNYGVKIMRPGVFEELRKKISYQIITICENDKFVDREDLLLFIMGGSKPKTMRLCWGADFDLLKPQKPSTITILVDHKYYGKEGSSLLKRDKTGAIIKSLLKYKNSGHDIIIKHIGFGKVNEVTDDYVVDNYKQSKAMDFRDIYSYYNEAHIFVVTHPECFGLSTIECASAGTLIVQPHGCMTNYIISRLHHVTINDMENIDWDLIIKYINVKRSIAMAKIFSYENAVYRVYQHMKKSMLIK